MTGYRNLSFETGDATVRDNIEGDSILADNWTSSGTSGFVEYIDWNEAGTTAEPAERFEVAWTGIDDFKFTFAPGFVDLEQFIFNSGLNADVVETFDFWVPNYVFDLTRLQIFLFVLPRLQKASRPTD